MTITLFELSFQTYSIYTYILKYDLVMPRACIIIHLWFVFQCITSNNWLVWTRRRKKKRQVYRKEHSGVSVTSLSIWFYLCRCVILSDMYTKIKDQYIHSFSLQFNSLYCCRFILCDLSKLMPEESLTNLKLLLSCCRRL